jgi:hypothetical protein
MRPLGDFTPVEPNHQAQASFDGAMIIRDGRELGSINGGAGAPNSDPKISLIIVALFDL